MGEEAVELRPHVVEVGEVADAQRAASRLVLVRRADAAPRRADLARAARVLAQPVELAVEWQDQRAQLADLQVFGRDLDALTAQFLDLRLEVPRVEHDAVPDDRQRAADDPCWAAG